jgi:hypothetical protein
MGRGHQILVSIQSKNDSAGEIEETGSLRLFSILAEKVARSSRRYDRRSYSRGVRVPPELHATKDLMQMYPNTKPSTGWFV